eukprot:5148597-Alexandrium_andersonii.AAC.1
MSASLVGSEMCIRDRPGQEGPPKRKCMPLGNFIKWGMPLGWVLPHAVSYTHLTLPTICSV